jgi:hypothetical protein
MSRAIRAYSFAVILSPRTRTAVARTAALAAATVCSAMMLASPAAAAVSDKHLAVDCPQPYSQACPPRDGLSVTTSGPMIIRFTADGNPPECAPGVAQIYVDGRLANRTKLEPGMSLARDYSRLPGTHQVEIQMDGVLGGCNTGAMSGWSGSLHVETDGDALRDLPAGPPVLVPGDQTGTNS